MKPCRIVSLYSGSGGNATYLKVGETEILIDAGKSCRALCSALRQIGSDLDEIKAIFVTHDHHDHVSALEILSKKMPAPIHMTDRSAEVFDRCPDSPVHEHLVRHKNEFRVTVGELEVTAFRTSHDSRMSVCYRVDFPDGERVRSIGVATDIGFVSDGVREALSGCEAVVLESNHDVEMLMEGSYPYNLKRRIRSDRGHLCNRDSAAFAAELAEKGTRAFLLAHLSEENNTPEVALGEAESAIADPSVVILAASPDTPTELIWSQEEICRDRCEAYNPWNA